MKAIKKGVKVAFSAAALAGGAWLGMEAAQSLDEVTANATLELHEDVDNCASALAELQGTPLDGVPRECERFGRMVLEQATYTPNGVGRQQLQYLPISPQEFRNKVQPDLYAREDFWPLDLPFAVAGVLVVGSVIHGVSTHREMKSF